MRVLPGVDVSKVKVTGPGVQGTTPASMPAQFKVDTRDAGVADLECVVQVCPSDAVKQVHLQTCFLSLVMFFTHTRTLTRTEKKVGGGPFCDLLINKIFC